MQPMHHGNTSFGKLELAIPRVHAHSPTSQYIHGTAGPSVVFAHIVDDFAIVGKRAGSLKTDLAT